MSPDVERHYPEMASDLVRIGEIVKPHGIRGEVKVYSYSAQPENFQNYGEVVLREPAGGRTETYRVAKSREQGRLAILQLEGVTTREEAEALQGWTVWLKEADFQALGPDEYYWHQLEGLSVFTESGRKLGRVAGLFRTPAHDIMVVAGTGHEYMIPVTADIVRRIESQEGKITISPPAGLLEINK